MLLQCLGTQIKISFEISICESQTKVFNKFRGLIWISIVRRRFVRATMLCSHIATSDMCLAKTNSCSVTAGSGKFSRTRRNFKLRQSVVVTGVRNPQNLWKWIVFILTQNRNDILFQTNFPCHSKIVNESSICQTIFGQ